jgi:broad-specificity NMP kinase
MSRYLITGFPGTGKSAVAAMLRQRKLNALDADDLPNLAHWIDTTTGRLVKYSEKVPAKWREQHSWVWESTALRSLLASDESTLFLCGYSDNLADFYELFDKCFVLTADDATLGQRIISRNNNNAKLELDFVLKNHKAFEAEQLARGAIVIDSIPSIKLVVNNILRYVPNAH